MKNPLYPRSGRVCRACNSQTCWPQQMNRLLPQPQTDSCRDSSQSYFLCTQCKSLEKHTGSSYAACNVGNKSLVVSVTDFCEVLIRATLKCVGENCGIQEELIVPTQPTRSMSLSRLCELARQERWVIGRSDSHEACTKNHGQFPFHILKASLITLIPFIKCKKKDRELGVCTIWLPPLTDGGKPLSLEWPEDKWQCVIRCTACGHTDSYRATDVREVKDWDAGAFPLLEFDHLKPEFPLQRTIQCSERCGGKITLHEFYFRQNSNPRLALTLSESIKCTLGCTQNPFTTMHPNGIPEEAPEWWK